jgi:hypothetical protein
VRITLRGLSGEKRKIYWNGATLEQDADSNTTVFSISGNTTLTLGDAIAIGGTSHDFSGHYFAVFNGGTLEMRGNSEISQKTGNGLISLGYGNIAGIPHLGHLKMYDNSAIKDNTYVMATTATGLVRLVQASTFEMYNNASITGNRWAFAANDTRSNQDRATWVYAGNLAAVYGVGDIVFTMNDNSAICGNEMRAVYLQNSGENYPHFTMNGGSITNNGKKTFDYDGNTAGSYYALGGGIYLASALFEMKGGTIADNGVLDKPGSGIMAFTVVVDPITTPFILNGSVSITGNTIAFKASSATSRAYPHIGPNLTTNSPIVVDLVVTSNNMSNFDKRWPDKPFLAALPSEAVDISSKVALFALTSYYYLGTASMSSQDYTEDVQYIIDTYGYLRKPAAE